MIEQRLADALKQRDPAEPAAEERAWRIASAAFEERSPAREARRPRQRSRLMLAIAGILALGLAVLSPPGRAVAEWVEDAVRPGARDARPALSSLPADGRLLVLSRAGPWIVQPDGSKRLLGSYREAAWSPNGLFVAATRGRELLALEPGGTVRWSLARPRRISRATWAPSGFRVGYLAGADLRVVAGDGSGDRLVAGAVAPVTPAWRPGPEHVLAFADRAGRIRAVAPDSRRELWRLQAPAVTQLAWTRGGRRLLALSPRALRVVGASGALVRTIPVPRGTTARRLAVNPATGDAAVVLEGRAGGRVEFFPLERGGPSRRLFGGAGQLGDIAWSPDGRWLLVAWRDADQWLFLRQDGPPKIDAVSGIAGQFAPGDGQRAGFPSLGGWCCP